MNNRGVSIIVPAYNEEENIAAAIKSVTWAAKQAREPYEIIVVDDGSADKTTEAANKAAGKDRHIRVVPVGEKTGLGYAIRKGVNEAEKEYLSVFPGDNDMDKASLVELFRKKKAAELVVSYQGKSDTRKFFRRFASLVYISFVSRIFNMSLQYYNGPFICKTRLVKGLHLISTGFTIYAEIKIKLIKNGSTWEEIPFVHTGRVHGESKALRLGNILDSIMTTLRIWRGIEKI